MSNSNLVLEDANDIFLENFARRVGECTKSIHSIEKIKGEVFRNLLYSAYIVSMGAEWYMGLVDSVIQRIDNSNCLAYIDSKDVNLVRDAIVDAGFTFNQAGVYIEKKYAIDTDYSILGFVSDTNTYKLKGGR